jgi:1-deoxy-D-xylulose-5-phosphate synthase
MLVTALSLDGPSSVRYPRGEGLGVDMAREPEALEVGKAQVLREGADVVLLAVGSMVQTAREAAEKLAEEGIEATVVNARFVKPLDAETIASLAQSVGRIVTIEENALAGGFGSAVLELLESRGLEETRVRRLGIGDRFIPAGKNSILMADCGLDVDGIAAAARQLAADQGSRADARDA